MDDPVFVFVWNDGVAMIDRVPCRVLAGDLFGPLPCWAFVGTEPRENDNVHVLKRLDVNNARIDRLVGNNRHFYVARFNVPLTAATVISCPSSLLEPLAGRRHS